jgi:hypothetical protein
VPSRKVFRTIHLTSAGVVGTLVYAPNDVIEGTFENLVAFIFFPVMVITGLLMWFGVRIARRRASAHH